MFSSPSSGSASASIGVFTKSYRFSALRFLRNSPFCRPFTRLIPNSMNSKILTIWFYSTSNRTLVKLGIPHGPGKLLHLKSKTLACERPREHLRHVLVADVFLWDRWHAATVSCEPSPENPGRFR